MELKGIGKLSNTVDAGLPRTGGAETRKPVQKSDPLPVNPAPAIDMDKVIDDLGLNSDVSISFDPDLNQVIIQVMDGSTKKVLKQIPAEQYISFAKKFREVVGLLMDESA